MSQRPEQALFEEVALAANILPAFVEKDWFVVQAIKAIRAVDHNGFKVVFSGGTALSKAHGLLQRFSEDVDFRVIAPAQFLKKTALSGYKRVVANALRQAGFTFDETDIRARDENRFFAIDLRYETYFKREGALRPHVLVELTVRDPQLPSVNLPVASFVSQVANHKAEVQEIDCIDPVESAADKLSALVWRVPDRIRGSEYDDPSLVRHIHDLAILKNQALSSSRFASLVQQSMQEDIDRSKNNESFANQSIEQKFARMMSLLTEDQIYLQEYEVFVRNVSYAPSDALLTYDQAVGAVEALIQEVLASQR